MRGRFGQREPLAETAQDVACYGSLGRRRRDADRDAPAVKVVPAPEPARACGRVVGIEDDADLVKEHLHLRRAARRPRA